MTQANSSTVGTVYLIGAGPGDPGMLTLRGRQCLQRADVVLYDYLVNPQILAWARPQAERVCLGRHGRGRMWSQEQIEQRMVADARAGRTVARIKGGDPAVFARAAEECQALLDARIPFEVVPGITAALAAASSTGIPLTHRDLASAVALITGQQHPGHEHPPLDYDALARFPGTLVFYMGVTTAPQWTAELIRAGKSPATPAAIVRHCSLPQQRVIYCTLGDLPQRLAAQPRLRPPAVIIVGEVVAARAKAWWFESRPLYGVRVLVTRPIEQAAELCDRFAEWGADVAVQPVIEIAPPPDWRPVDAALDRLASFDWVVFSSANGVQRLLDRLLETGRDPRAFGSARLAAIGPGTADELARYHLRADLTPTTYRAEALAEALAPSARGRRFLLARASRGREVLAEALRAAEGEVEQVVVYESRDIPHADTQISEQLRAGNIDWVTVTSSAIARSLFRLFGTDLAKARLASISPVTTATLRQLGLTPAVEADVYTMAGLADAIRAAVAAPPPEVT